MAPYSNIAKNLLGLGGQVLDLEDVAMVGPPPTYRDFLHHGVALCQQDPRMSLIDLIKWVNIISEHASFGFMQRIWDRFILLFNAKK